MTDSPTHYTLREMRRVFASSLTQLILFAIVILCAISGPFGTLELLNFGPRLAYWAVTVPATFAVGMFASTLISESLRSKYPVWAIRALVAFATSIAVFLTVLFLNWLAFDRAFSDMFKSLTLVLPIMVTAALVAFLLHYLSEYFENKSAEPTSLPPALLDRLDFDKRGALISLSVQDHYVEVTTKAGQALLLMRLKDAMRETGNVEGLQIHRSHWVALDQVTAVRRQGDKAIVTLSDGRTLPASRSHIKALKEAGLLAR